MLRGLFNIMLVFIICITATGMPVDREALNFSSILPAVQSRAEIDYSIEADDSLLKNPSTVHLNLIGQEDLSHLNLEKSFVLDVLDTEHQKISTFMSDDFLDSRYLNPENTQLTLVLNISQNALKLNNGRYILNIHSKAKELNKLQPILLSVEYLPIPIYRPSVNELKANTMALTLYFPVNSKHLYLAPITRFVPHNRASLRTTITHLQNGSELFKSYKDHIPQVPSLQLKGDMVTVNLTRDLAKYEDPTNGYFALKSIVDSLTSIPGIHKVKFLVGGREQENLFYHYSTQTIFETTASNTKAYLGVNVDDTRTLLMPVDLAVNGSNEAYNQIWHVLTTGDLNGTMLSDVIVPIPENISLLSSSFNGATLTLNLSGDFLEAYPDRTDLQRMMVDAILLSYTSVPGIDQVELLVENQKHDSFGDIQISAPLSRPKYVNPE